MAVTQEGPVGAELPVRTKLPPDVLAMSVMKTLRQLNPGQPTTQFRPIQEIVDKAVSPRRFFVLLVSAFAVLGLLLASLGIYGVISYSVTRQTQEIGIRMAIGATQAHMLREVIAGTLKLALAGIACGWVGSYAVARLIRTLLFHTAPTDPATFAGMTVVLGAVALLAGYLPARRASRINPLITLRNNQRDLLAHPFHSSAAESELVARTCFFGSAVLPLATTKSRGHWGACPLHWGGAQQRWAGPSAVRPYHNCPPASWRWRKR